MDVQPFGSWRELPDFPQTCRGLLDATEQPEDVTICSATPSASRATYAIRSSEARRHPAEETGCCRLCSFACRCIRTPSLIKRGGSRVGSLMHIRSCERPAGKPTFRGSTPSRSFSTLIGPAFSRPAPGREYQYLVRTICRDPPSNAFQKRPVAHQLGRPSDWRVDNARQTGATRVIQIA